MSGKNLRLLGEEPSPAWQPTMEEMIAALRAELAKGEAVYTPAELARLERKLADYEFMLQRMLSA
jgi:hypothetical protein